jgi:hypothetical protein
LADRIDATAKPSHPRRIGLAVLLDLHFEFGARLRTRLHDPPRRVAAILPAASVWGAPGSAPTPVPRRRSADAN